MVDTRAELHEVHLGPVALQGGTVLVQSDIASAYFLFIRYDFESSVVVENIWSISNKKWELPVNIPDEDRDKNVLQFTGDATYPWKGQFVLIGDKGKFESPLVGELFPKYAVQCYFTSRSIDNSTYTGNSTPTVHIMMGSFPPKYKARLEIEPYEDTDSEHIEILHDEVGSVSIRRSSGEILILHKNGAKVMLDNLGNISLIPSGSGDVNIVGDVNISGSLTVNGHVIV